MLYGRRFPLRLKEAVNKGYVRPTILYGSEAWCLKESEMGIFQRTERFMVMAMCGVQLKDNFFKGFHVHAGFEGNYGSVGYGKQCSLVWSSSLVC